MSKKIIIVTLAVLLLTAFLWVNNQITTLRNQNITNIERIREEILKRDSLLFRITPGLTSIISRCDSIHNKKRKRSLFVIIPEDTCWACFESKLNGLTELKNEYSTEVIFLTTNMHIRTLKIILKDEEFSNNVINYSDFEDVEFLPSKDIIYIMNDESNQNCMPYVESKLIDPIEFIKRNYYAGS